MFPGSGGFEPSGLSVDFRGSGPGGFPRDHRGSPKATAGESHRLRLSNDVPRLKAKRYLNSALLVVDEVGFRPLDCQEANLFFRLVSAR